VFNLPLEDISADGLHQPEAKRQETEPDQQNYSYCLTTTNDSNCMMNAARDDGRESMSLDDEKGDNADLEKVNENPVETNPVETNAMYTIDTEEARERTLNDERASRKRDRSALDFAGSFAKAAPNAGSKRCHSESEDSRRSIQKVALSRRSASTPELTLPPPQTAPTKRLKTRDPGYWKNIKAKRRRVLKDLERKSQSQSEGSTSRLEDISEEIEQIREEVEEFHSGLAEVKVEVRGVKVEVQGLRVEWGSTFSSQFDLMTAIMVQLQKTTNELETVTRRLNELEVLRHLRD